MKATTEKIINKYLNFSGERSEKDFREFNAEITAALKQVEPYGKDFTSLMFLKSKILKGWSITIEYKSSIIVIIEDSLQDIENGHDPIKPDLQGNVRGIARSGRKAKRKTLGKLVDHGEVPPGGRSDEHWGREGVDILFMPNDTKVRSGSKIPSTYKYRDVRFLEKHYSLKAIEFGNWLSEQDRVNYLSGFGISMFDLANILGFKPKQLSLNGKLSVAFGARGRGAQNAHFAPDTFTINLSRYSRPVKFKNRPSNYDRVNLILTDGGIGAYAHEFGHALDCYAGTFIEKTESGYISGRRSTRTTPDEGLMKKKNLQGYMEKLLNRILWKNAETRSAYYERLKKATDKMGDKITEYYFRRTEIFARAFESFVHYKMLKKKYKNVFLGEVKYSPKVYLTPQEIKSLEKDFDTLINALKKRI